jgi:hypothetical protein
MTAAPPRECRSTAAPREDWRPSGKLRDTYGDRAGLETVGGGAERRAELEVRDGGWATAGAKVAPARMTVSGAISTAHAARFQQSLTGDEVVQVVLKPSLWYIAVLSWRWVLGVVLLHACILVSGQGTWTATHTILFQGGVLLAVGRTGFAVMQWSSRWYLLTNRRVMRRSGVLRPEERHCLLTRVCAVKTRVNAWQRMLRIGSVQIQPAEDKAAVVGWNFVQNPARVHEMIEAAVRKAQCGGDA